MTLNEELEARLAQFRATKPPEIVALMQKANDELRASGILNRASSGATARRISPSETLFVSGGL